MKYLLIIGDGMADNPVPELGGLTPLEAAEKPFMDKLSREGILGRVCNCPEGFPPGSDVAIMSIFGCDPKDCYSGRAPLEAAAQGVHLQVGDAAFRCNMVTLSEGESFADRTIVSHSGCGLSGEESIELIHWLFAHPDFAPLAERARVGVYPTPSYRHIAVRRQADVTGGVFPPPHDHLGERVGDNLPHGCADAEELASLMEAACAIMESAPVNERRRAAGKAPCNGIWFWAEGTAAALPDFVTRYSKGAVVSAVPLCHGIARLVGLDAVIVPTANGEWDTDYEAKVAAGLAVLRENDFVALHLEGPDEATHNGQLKEKVQAIEWLSSRVIEPLCVGLREMGEDYRVLILSDHKTLTSTRGHDGDPVPYILYDSRKSVGSGLSYTEKNAENGPLMEAGTGLMAALFEI